MTPQKCAACHRKAIQDGKYCEHHQEASARLIVSYKEWVDAYGGISWEDFLNKLSKMRETGIWIKEVIAIELKK